MFPIDEGECEAEKYPVNDLKSKVYFVEKHTYTSSYVEGELVEEVKKELWDLSVARVEKIIFNEHVQIFVGY